MTPFCAKIAVIGWTHTNDSNTSRGDADSPSELLMLEVAVEILVRPDCLEINKTNTIVHRIAEQVELTLATEFMDPQICQVALLALTDCRRFGDLDYCPINVCGNVIVKSLVLTGKAASL
jgi:hypothetical protein